MKSLTDLAGNLDASAAQVLTALRIVAARADVEEIVEWAAKELEGYQEEDELPAHRISPFKGRRRRRIVNVTSIQYWITCPGRDRRTNKRGNLYRPNEELIRIQPTS